MRPAQGEWAGAMEAKMAYVARPSDFHSAVPFKGASAPAAAPLSPARRRLWLRILDSILESRAREAETTAAQYIARRGKRTDSIEREIGERIMGQGRGFF